ncbi:MAG: transposase [Planctomycetes bacterium]|nr:transposase [Planctomycetota bacterium]
MMGQQQSQKDLFSYSVDLDKRVRSENPLRRLAERIDFTFVRAEVNDFYGYNGNESVDPAVIMKMMLLLFFDDVASERELMRIIAERLDYMWFLGYGLDEEIPNHSVLSKARARWGVDVFETLFTRIVAQCKLAGLIEGKKLHMDGSLVDANASNNAVLKGCPELIAQLRGQLHGEMAKLDEPKDDRARIYYERKNKGLLNTTDPDAAIVRKGKNDGSRARYKTHRAVDDACGVITATETTPGDVEENAKLMDLVDQHERNTGQAVETVVADKQYGTAENFRTCNERGIRSHMGDMLAPQLKKGRREGIFGYEDFTYDPNADTFTCPAGQTLTRRKHKKTRKAYEYACPIGVCGVCSLRPQCTRAEGAARTVKRHYNQEAVDAGRAQSQSVAAKRDRLRRKWLMEGSFADGANNHGFKRSRWRRLWRQQIQDYLIAAVQNLRILMRHIAPQPPALAQALRTAGQAAMATICVSKTALSRALQIATRFAAASSIDPLLKDQTSAEIVPLLT